MASYRAIQVISDALAGVFADANALGGNRTVFEKATFPVCQLEGLQQNPTQDGVGLSVCLYQVAFNSTRRNLPPREDPANARRFRPSTPLDLHYLISAWDQLGLKDARTQQQLLGWAVRTLQDTPRLPSGYLNSFAGNAGNVFREDEQVELVGESLSLQDQANIWEVAKARQQPSLSYVVRMVVIDSEVELGSDRPVLTRLQDFRQPAGSATP